MRVLSSTRFAAMAVLVGALACAGNKAETDSDEAAAARDTTTADTLGGDQNQPGYRGMERDTTIAPTGQQPSDTFLQNQGVGAPQDTSGYSGAERVDTTGQANPAGAARDTMTMTPTDTSMTPSDTSWTDTTGYKPSAGDTTGYNPSQQPGDSVPR
jgi:hypothetical protein